MQAYSMYKIKMLASWAKDNRVDVLSIVGAFVAEGMALLSGGAVRSSDGFQIGIALVSFLLWYGVIDFVKLINIKCAFPSAVRVSPHTSHANLISPSPGSRRLCCRSIRSSPTSCTS